MNKTICKYTFDINEIIDQGGVFVDNGIIQEGDVIDCYDINPSIYPANSVEERKSVYVVVNTITEDKMRKMTHIPLDSKTYSEHFYTYEEHQNVKRTEMIDKMLNNKNDKNDIFELIYTNKKDILCTY